MQDTLKRMVAQASRTITPLTAVLLDLDHFKQINDLYGHDAGDEVLAAVGVAMRLAMRESDFVGRYGGEEFLMLLPVDRYRRRDSSHRGRPRRDRRDPYPGDRPTGHRQRRRRNRPPRCRRLRHPVPRCRPSPVRRQERRA